MGPQTGQPDETEGSSEAGSEQETETTTTPDGTSTDAGPDNTSPDTQCPPRTEITATAHGGRTPRRCASIRGPQPDPQKQDKKAGTSPHTSGTATTKKQPKNNMNKDRARSMR
jgi:hypothetical protein